MSRIDDLPADRRAVLQLLLKQGKSYDDLAALLRIEPDAVRERARDALDRLGPAGGAADLDPDEQDEIADYLLGQQSATQRASTRELLEISPAGRAWARVVSGELRTGGMGSDTLPEIPAERAEVDEAFDALEARKSARERQAKSSRLGGVLLLAAVGLAVAFLIVFVLTGDDDGDDPGTGATTTEQTATTGGQEVLGQVNLKAVEGSPNPDALAAVTLVRQGDVTALSFTGQDIPRNTRGNVYALWLISDSEATRLGFSPRVGRNGRLNFQGPVPEDVDLADYTAMVLSRETTREPRTPGPVIVAGPLPTS